jgi:vesicle coat complex subunit
MLKKLLLIFWEVVPKTDSEGKLMQEMILVCDAYRKDLQHPNEFIRGATLRFLCKLKVGCLTNTVTVRIPQPFDILTYVIVSGF